MDSIIETRMDTMVLDLNDPRLADYVSCYIAGRNKGKKYLPHTDVFYTSMISLHIPMVDESMEIFLYKMYCAGYDQGYDDGY